MADLLLIHGSCHGAWCWRDVLPLLAAAGHRARAIDMPCRAGDATRPEEASVDLYADRILAAIEGPTMVVGHSLAGMFITAAAEKGPALISRLVFLSAWLPISGNSARDMRDWAPSNPLADAAWVDEGGCTSSFDPALVVQKFYQDCPDDAVAFARANLCPEPLGPQRTPVFHGENFASVSKSYITCTEDQAIDPQGQALMAEQLPEADRYTLDCGHSPFFARPGKLAQTLDEIARK